MDPIKVDFSKKGGPKEIVIPPDKAALKIILSVLCSIVTAGIAFYIMLPPLNFKAYEFYGFLAIIIVSYALFSAIFTGVFSKPEYLPYFKRQMIVPRRYRRRHRAHGRYRLSRLESVLQSVVV